MRQLKSLKAFAALVLVSMIALTGCSSPTASTTSAAEPAADFDPEKQYEIVFESYNIGNATWDPVITGLIEDFEEQHPNIDVVPQALGADSTGAGGTAQSVQRQVLAGNAPDVVQMTFDAMSFGINELQAKPLDTVVGADSVNEHFEGEYPMHENVRDFAKDGDHIYGIPYVLSTPMFYYNESALADIGITNPDFSSWESVAEIAAQASEATGSPSLSVSCFDDVGEWCLQSIIRSAGGQMLSEDGTTIEFGSPESAEALTVFQDIAASGALENADFNGQVESFAAGNTLMHVNTASMQTAFENGAEAGDWSLHAVGMPGFDGDPAIPVSSGSALMMYSEDPDQQAAAWEFIKFMTSEVAYEQIAPLGYLPLRTGLIEEGAPLADWAAQNDLLAPNLEQLERIEPWVSYPGSSYAQVTPIVIDAVEEIVYGGEDAESTLTEAADQAQELIEQ